ncbi:hypothetical protein GIB67_006314 [Kingdonia uniflora]|uniref:DNA2/NAM7 helicase helicase domain-containing protein n=1 Tax=Kingdonia uniflora TaxID=39325 RepID=A0A7J7P5W3_9MAGN|nr:hypothetical protein GIB67_006314 [Kingdonia uniflora]
MFVFQLYKPSWICALMPKYKGLRYVSLKLCFQKEPIEMLVIDEVAQLKERESFIPLKLPDIRHAILIGDECQLRK